MKIDFNSNNRLAIYFFYDKDGIVDDYVSVMIEAIKKHTKEVLFVSNGKLTEDSLKKIEKLNINILQRENKGFDVWAYKEGMEYYGWDRLEEFDEVILMNFTIFGPLYDFSEMFESMSARDLDFWGITKCAYVPFDPFGTIEYGYIPEHIQSHFIVIRKNLMLSGEFKFYWENMRIVSTYQEAIGFHEAIFTKKFKDKGYKFEVYVDTDDMKSNHNLPINMNPLELVKNKKCPIIKRRSFFNDYNDYLNYNVGQPSKEILKYIKDEKLFDVDLIFDNILRVQNQLDLNKSAHLNYILSTKSEYIDALKNKQIALVMHCYFESLIEYCFRYAKSMPKSSDIYITTDTIEKKKKIEKVFGEAVFNRVEIIIVENRGRDVSALLVATKGFIYNYDYVCFAHDKKVSQIEISDIGESFSYKCFENILYNEAFVRNVIGCFEENHRLGMMSPPPPNHADYFATIGNVDWKVNCENVKNLADELNLKIDIHPDKEPIAPLGTMFWFRPEALKSLFDKNWEYEDFPEEPNDTDGTLLHAIERIYPLVVQHEGYYPSYLMNSEYASLEYTNLKHMLSEIVKLNFEMFGSNSFWGLTTTIKYHLNHGSAPNSEDLLRALLKEKVKSKMPASIWNVSKQIYFSIKRIYFKIRR